MVYNKKYIFGLLPCIWHRAPETLGILCVMRALKVSFVMLMRRLLDLTEGLRGACSQENSCYE